MSASDSIPTLADYQRQAHEYLKGERWQAALQLLQTATRQFPDSADLFSDLAAAERAAGSLDDAIKHFQEALRLDPKLAFVHNNLGHALVERNDTREAIDCYHRALVLQPRYPAALNNLAQALLKESRVDEARKVLERLFGITREHLPAFETLAALCERQGNHQEALKHYGSLAQHYLKVGKPADALRAMDACQRLGLRSAALQTNRSAALLQLGRPAEAKTAAQMALQLDPNHANAHVNLASAFVALQDNRSAIPCLKRATDLAPNLAPAFINLGNAYTELGEFSEARVAHRRALEIAPDAVQAMVGLAAALQMEGQREEALALYRRALTLAPNFAEAHRRYGEQLLLRGDLKDGFAECEWRKFEQPLQSQLARYPGSPYAGEPLAGRTLLLAADEGLGKAIQFIRYAAPLHARGARIIVDCPRPLIRLFQGQPFVDRAFSFAEEPLGCDYFVPLMSLAQLAETTLETIPREVPYLTPPLEGVRPPELGRPELKVGVVWTTPPRFRSDHFRSINLGLLDELGDIHGLSWFSLQVGAGREQIAGAQRLRLTDLAPYLTDLADAASTLSRLDLLITVDSEVAHLAGALGVQTWTLLPEYAEWTWHLGRSDSPWYPRMRLFRQRHQGDWRSVIEDLRAALTDWSRTQGNMQPQHVMGG
jgi:tetratricopeptide (TPR) repeat protein